MGAKGLGRQISNLLGISGNDTVIFEYRLYKIIIRAVGREPGKGR